MKKAKLRKEAHNVVAELRGDQVVVVTHEERMNRRRAVQKLRRPSIFVSTGYFTPSVEDKKHSEWRKSLKNISHEVS